MVSEANEIISGFLTMIAFLDEGRPLPRPKHGNALLSWSEHPVV